MGFLADHWPDATTAVVREVPWRMFSGCNYLGLAQHPKIVAAARLGLERHGIAANGSPLTTGKVEVHELLEERLAAFIQQPAALLVPDGHLANVAACQAIAALDGECVALVDELAHDSLNAAARAAGFAVHRYRHADAGHAARLCQELGSGKATVLTDTLFGASGELAPVAALLDALPQSATLVLDDGHGLGVLGPAGRGAFAGWRRATGLTADPNSESAALAAPYARVVVTSSLSKGLGCYGGIVAAGAPLVDAVRQRAGAYGGTTPIPPALAEAAIAALNLLEQDSARVTRLRENAGRVRAALIEHGQRVPPVGVPIFCLALGNEVTQELQAEFERQKLGVPLVTYANGPAQQYFRIAVSAEHTSADLDALLAALASAL